MRNIGTAALFSFLLISGIFGIFANTSGTSATTPVLPADWNGSEGTYGSNNNYSPQTSISAANVKSLVPSWVWPVPVNSIFADQGVELPPIVVNGVVYLLSQSQRIYALNLQSGSVVWEKDIPTTYNPKSNVFDSHAGAGTIRGLPTGHYHSGSWAYTTQLAANGQVQPLLWVFGNNMTMFVFNALTGTQVERWTLHGFPNNIPGSYNIYDNVTPEMIVDEANQQMIVGTTVCDCSTAGRGVWLRYSTTTTPPTFEGYTFITPPQNGADPNWTLNQVGNMTAMHIFNGTGWLDVKALAQSNPSAYHTLLYKDWGNFGFNGTNAFAGAGDAFGGPYAFDSHLKMFFVTTGQPSPDSNSSVRPGPDLFSDSILAISETTGNYVWGVQTFPHDNIDYDCSWNTMLANITYNGAVHEAVIKGCKSGYITAVDAKTGTPLWFFTSPQSVVKRSLCTMPLNPLNHTDMIKPYCTYPSKTAYIVNPTATGSQESDISYDPTTNLVFAAQFNNPSKSIQGGGDVLPTIPAGYKPPSSGGCPSTVCVKNTTLWAIDAATGKSKWSVFLPNLAFRGGVTVSNGVVYLASLDGVLRYYSESDGSLLKTANVGGPAGQQPVLAQDTQGNQYVVQVIGVSEEFAGVNPLGEVPGYVIAYQAQAPSSGGITTVTTNVGGGTTTGIDPTTFYAVTAVAVIFIIVTGVLALRRRAPAS